MRRILLALVTLACMAPAAEARRDERGREAPGRPVQQQAAKPQPGKVAPVAQATRPASVRQVASRQTSSRATTLQAPQRFSELRPGDVRTSRSGLVVRGATAATVSREAVASCSRRQGRTVCGGSAREASGIAGWQSGLPRVDYAQRACPDGTFATLAAGHEDVVRCMPL